MELELAFRGWKYFRQGFGLYLSYPLSIFNFMTLAYYVMADKIPFLQVLFPSFGFFAGFSIVSLIPLGVVLGYIHMKKSGIYKEEAIVVAESNALSCYINRVTMEMIMQLYEKMEIPISEDYMKLYLWWKKHDEKRKWRPK